MEPIKPKASPERKKEIVRKFIKGAIGHWRYTSIEELAEIYDSLFVDPTNTEKAPVDDRMIYDQLEPNFVSTCPKLWLRVNWNIYNTGPWFKNGKNYVVKGSFFTALSLILFKTKFVMKFPLKTPQELQNYFIANKISEVACPDPEIIPIKDRVPDFRIVNKIASLLNVRIMLIISEKKPRYHSTSSNCSFDDDANVRFFTINESGVQIDGWALLLCEGVFAALMKTPTQ